MKEDIMSKEDINKLVQAFYAKVKEDDSIGYFFTDAIKVNWINHSMKMSDFLENVLFYTGEYNGDPLNSHKEFHKRFPTNVNHFNRWKVLFNETLDEHFKGANTEKLRTHALSIADIMVQNINKF
jgi:hemoglobin